MTIKGCQGVTIPGKVQLPLHQTETIIEEHSRIQCEDEQIMGTPASMCSSCVYDSGTSQMRGSKHCQIQEVSPRNFCINKTNQWQYQ